MAELPQPPQPRRVLIATRDLFFRARLEALVRSAGAEVTRDDPAADLAVLELGAADSADRIRGLVGRGITVVAFGSHVGVEALRAARSLGARAVPNSEVERVLRALLVG